MINGKNCIISFYENNDIPASIQVIALDIKNKKSCQNTVIFYIDDLRYFFHNELHLLQVEHTDQLCQRLQSMLVWIPNANNQLFLAIDLNVYKLINNPNKKDNKVTIIPSVDNPNNSNESSSLPSIVDIVSKKSISNKQQIEENNISTMLDTVQENTTLANKISIQVDDNDDEKHHIIETTPIIPKKKSLSMLSTKELISSKRKIKTYSN